MFHGKCRFQAAALLAAFLAVAGSKPAVAQGAAPPAPGVVVQKIGYKEVARGESFTGRIEAIDKVELKARVAGTLQERRFEEGGKVRKDDVLFVIDKAPYQIAVEQAQAAVANAEAAVKLAQVTYDRAKQLVAQSFTSKSDFDKAAAQLDQANATLQSQQAALDNAQLNLGYTDIRAPIDGAVGRASVSIGNYVTLESGALATLVSLDPVYATFPVPLRLLLEVRRLKLQRSSVVVYLTLPDGSRYEHPGEIQFEDVSANPNTDTVTVRARMPNPDGLLDDQQIIRVEVQTKEPERRLVVPQASVLLDQQGSYVLVVNAEDTVEQRRLKLGQQTDASFVVEDGLKEGDRVIVSGLQKVRPGIKVTAQEAAPAAEQTGN